MKISKEVAMSSEKKIAEQEAVLNNSKKNMLISASAGSGKTYIMIKYISKLICDDHVPVKDFLVLTFTKAAANEMKSRLEKRLKEHEQNEFVIEQIDALSTANISTIHAFCEKMLKKYANLLSINENFSIADDNYAQKLCATAVEQALVELKNEDEDAYHQLVECYKNNDEKIKNVIFEMENLINALANREEFLNKIEFENETYFDKALNYLFDNAQKELKNNLKLVEAEHIFDFENVLKDTLRKVLTSENLFEMSQALADFKFPFLPKRKECGDEVVDRLNKIKDNINKIFDKIKGLNLTNEDSVDFQKIGLLEKNLLKLYKKYEKNQNLLKKSQNLLDFYDLEKYMKILSKQENLFSGIKYVFVDEYQDTNKIQDEIIKSIAKNSNFVAVGDAKQGIYGFRLASAEIFLKDLKDFEEDQNSQVNFLKSNFRSDKNVLNFVNDVFKVCMTKRSCGIDYENSSMVKGEADFVSDGQKTIYIDIVKEDKQEFVLPNIYSVKNAEAVVENKQKNMLNDIKRRILECLGSQISDGGKLRPCRYGDIAILSRGRDDLYRQLCDFLQQNQIPVMTNSRDKLFDESQILVLLNFLKLVLSFDDEVALLSVLNSALVGLDLQKLTDEKLEKNQNLIDLVLQSKNPKILKFLENLQKFRLNLQIFGIKMSFLTLFRETDYRAYLNTLPNSKKVNEFVDKFLSEIESSGYDYDLPSLLSYFESVDISVTSEPSAVDNSVLLTTIHNSKGLEYPIVFLIGCDSNLKKPNAGGSDVRINDQFGLGVKFYDKETNQETDSVKMLAIKEMESKKDFVEELMIFYVALTRAKNRIYLFGKDDNFEKISLESCSSYFDFIFYAKPSILKALNESDCYEDEHICATVLDEVEENKFDTNFDYQNGEIDEQLRQDFENYIDFSYKFSNFSNFKSKESVTSLSQKEEDDISKFSNVNIQFSSAAIETGNAYHLALKVIDFDKVKTFEDLASELEKNKDVLKEDVALINKDILYKNIILLKTLTDGADKIFKEKEFIMKEQLSKLTNFDIDERVLVQGVVDLFVIKDGHITLIDYKFSGAKNRDYLIEKYTPQLRAYKIALEESFGLKVEKTFLLSLKNADLIEVNF